MFTSVKTTLTILSLLFSLIKVAFARLFGIQKEISYDGKHVVVTGAASGIGRATCEELLARGCQVYCCDINEAALTELYRDQHNATTIVMNVTDAESVKNAAKVVAAKTGVSGLFALVNSAGVADLEGMTKCLFEESEGSMNKVMGVNFFGVANCVNAFVPLLIEYTKSAKRIAHETPSIVNIASLAGLQGLMFSGYYSPSKFAVVGYSDCLRQELSYLDIRVTCVEPGFVNTPLLNFKPQADPTSVLYSTLQKIRTEGSVDAVRVSAQPVGKVSAAIRYCMFHRPAPEHMLVDLPAACLSVWLATHVLPHWFTDSILRRRYANRITNKAQ